MLGCLNFVELGRLTSSELGFAFAPRNESLACKVRMLAYLLVSLAKCMAMTGILHILGESFAFATRVGLGI